MPNRLVIIVSKCDLLFLRLNVLQQNCVQGPDIKYCWGQFYKMLTNLGDSAKLVRSDQKITKLEVNPLYTFNQSDQAYA